MKNLCRKNTIYDAAIIGAGPAGASLAYFLSDSGLKVVLIEKKKVADIPVRCAELVPGAITQLYNDKISGINNEINNMETYIGGELANIIKSDGFILDRNIFVDFLIREYIRKNGAYVNSANFLNAEYLSCQNQGIRTRPGRNLKSPYDKTGSAKNKTIKISVYSDKNKEVINIKTKILVGADGTNSKVSRIMNSFFSENNDSYKKSYNAIPKGIQSDNAYIVAFQENLMRKKDYGNNAKIFFYPYLTCGYGWLFPKKESINVGLAINPETVKRNGLKNTYFRFKNDLVKNDIINGDEKQNSVVSGLAPVSGISPELVKSNIMIIGDAAGLCNPITGAGNFNAAVSAKIASEYIKKAISTGDSDILKEAGKEINNFFNISLSRAKNKRVILEEGWSGDNFEDLIKKTWISFKDYWQRGKVKSC